MRMMLAIAVGDGEAGVDERRANILQVTQVRRLAALAGRLTTVRLDLKVSLLHGKLLVVRLHETLLVEVDLARKRCSGVVHSVS